MSGCSATNRLTRSSCAGTYGLRTADRRRARGRKERTVQSGLMQEVLNNCCFDEQRFHSRKPKNGSRPLQKGIPGLDPVVEIQVHHRERNVVQRGRCSHSRRRQRCRQHCSGGDCQWGRRVVAERPRADRATPSEVERIQPRSQCPRLLQPLANVRFSLSRRHPVIEGRVCGLERRSLAGTASG